MKKALLATTMVVALMGSATAQELTISGFVEFEAHMGHFYDQKAFKDRSVESLDFAVDGRLDFDYVTSTKSGLEYGMHLKLDLFSSDAHTNEREFGLYYDYKNGGQSDVAFNDGYVFLNSALGNVKLGDTGAAGEASNQLNVPFLAPGAMEISNLASSEAEQVFYSNSFLGVDFEASVDDDSNWGLGIGYSAAVGVATVDLGLSAGEEALAGSLGANIGGLSFGVNYAHEEVGATTEYVAAGASYNLGALTVGAGAETKIAHAVVTGQEYTSNFFAGGSYELADGVVLGVGIANLDSDSCSNWTAVGGSSVPGSCFAAPLSTFNNELIGQGQHLGDDEGRTWTAGASVLISF